MNDFTFYSPIKFIFGREAIEAVGEELSRRSFRKALIVYGGISAVRSGVLARVKASLDANGVAYEEMGGVRPNPELKEIRAGIKRSSKHDCLLRVRRLHRKRSIGCSTALKNRRDACSARSNR